VITDVLTVLIGVVALILIIGLLALYYLRGDDDDLGFDDDYFSDIQDAVQEDDNQVEGQLKLWETGSMPAIATETPMSTTPTVTASSPTAGTDAAGTAAPAGATPTTNWWENVDPDVIHAAAQLIAQPSPVPSVEDDTPAASEAVSVVPEPVEDTQQWSIRMDDEASLWWTQQEAERARWRGEMGLSDDDAGDQTIRPAA
jgi:hypothetical protein